MTAMVAGRYRIEETIGQGGMGIVYRATDLRMNEVVALKQLRREATTAKPELIERFLREAAALRDLNHPNIVRAYETVDDGEHYIVMDYIEGSDLGDFLRRYGRIPMAQTLRIGLELADALTRAHYLKIVHRDLKPANVLIQTDGTPKLTDFGVAYFSGRERVTDTAIALGTPQYMAPEMLRGEPPDARADIWSLGVIIFELLTGTHPFSGATITDLLMNIMTGEPPDLEKMRPDTPVELADLVYRMLAKDRDVRIPSVRLVGSELEPILAKLNADGGKLTPMAVPVRRSTDFNRTQGGRTVKNNIPTLPVPFIGREAPSSDVLNLLNLPDVRLLTVLGPGGVGKTRLVIETARRMAELSSDATDTSMVRYVHGVFFVPLASLTRPEHLPGAIANAIGFRFTAGADQRAQLLNYLREKAMLLVIDSADRALTTIGLLADMLQAAPRLKVLTTSRARLNLTGETVYTLEGLTIEDNLSPERIAETSAYKLFVASARRAKPGFEPNGHDARSIAGIVQRVGGLPLGIELAAAWVNQLSIDEIAAEVVRSLDFLDSGDHDRHGSLRAVFEQSWHLLSDDERTTLTRIAVFRGRFSRAAGQTVTGASLRQLMNLVNKGILRRSPDTDIYQIDELTRQYAEEKLNQSEEVAVIRDAHMRYYVNALSTRTAMLYTREQREVMRVIEADMNNFRAAWFRAVKHGNFEELALAVTTFALYFEMVGQYDEAEEVIVPAIESVNKLESSSPRDAALAYLHMWRSILQSTDGDPAKARQSLEQAEQLLTEDTSQQQRYVLALAQGMVQLNYGDPVESRACFEQAAELLRQSGGGAEMSRPLIWLGRSYYFRLGAEEMNLEEARKILAQARDIALENGDEYSLAVALFCLGTVAMYSRDIDSCERLLRQSESSARNFGSLHIAANALNNLGYGLMDAGRLRDARACMEENLAIRREQGNPLLIVWALFAVHQIEYADGLYEMSFAHASEGLRLISGTSHREWECNMLYALGESEWMLGQYHVAEAHFQRMCEIAEDINDRDNICLANNCIGITRFALKDYDSARNSFETSLVMAERSNDPNMIAANHIWLGRIGLIEGRYEDAQRLLIEALEYLVNDEQQRPSYTWYEANRFDYISIAHFTMASIAMRRGNLTSARERLWLAMRAAMRIGGARMILQTLGGVAELLSLRGEPLRAVEWCSAILGHPRCAAPNRGTPEAVLERTRTLIPEEEYEAAITRGALIGLDELVAEAAVVLTQA